jgi:hypothetical protein
MVFAEVESHGQDGQGLRHAQIALGCSVWRSCHGSGSSGERGRSEWPSAQIGSDLLPDG